MLETKKEFDLEGFKSSLIQKREKYIEANKGFTFECSYTSDTVTQETQKILEEMLDICSDAMIQTNNPQELINTIRNEIFYFAISGQLLLEGNAIIDFLERLTVLTMQKVNTNKKEHIQSTLIQRILSFFHSKISQILK
jgi:hypothetical protein